MDFFLKPFSAATTTTPAAGSIRFVCSSIFFVFVFCGDTVVRPVYSATSTSHPCGSVISTCLFFLVFFPAGLFVSPIVVECYRNTVFPLTCSWS